STSKRSTALGIASSGRRAARHDTFLGAPECTRRFCCAGFTVAFFTAHSTVRIWRSQPPCTKPTLQRPGLRPSLPFPAHRGGMCNQWHRSRNRRQSADQPSYHRTGEGGEKGRGG